jgi:lysophospholipase L1-like esterase
MIDTSTRKDPAPMPNPLPLPIRVLVKGASTVGWLSGMGGSRADFTFPRVIEQELLQSGRPVELRTYSVPSERTKTTLRHWEAEMIGYSPDVVVLVYGHYESIHFLLPWWLERHANSLKQRPGRIREAYRKRLLRPVWMFLARLQARADTALDPTMRRSRPRRVAADMERLIGHIQELHSPLVFVFELLPPAKRYQSWFPGMTERIAVMNESLAAMIARVDRPNVRLVPISDLVTEHADGDIDVATPDGFHYSTDLHRAIGRYLAGEIGSWAETQPHLQPRASAARRRTKPSDGVG